MTQLLAIKMTLVIGSLAWGLFHPALAFAGTPTPDEKAMVGFSVEWDVGVGRAVFVTGNHADLGNWNPVRARKLRWTPGNVWTGSVAITAGHPLEYKYIVRTNTGAAYCEAANVIWMAGPNLATNLPARPGAPYTGKTVYYITGWTNAFLLHRSGSDTNWFNAPMQRLGPGRFAGEFLYRADGLGQAGEWITFVPNGYFNGVQHWDNTPFPNIQDYTTRLDAFLLQDGHIYNDWPPASRTESAIASHAIVSSYTPAIPSRNIRVYTPRNYTQNPHKRYPVLYLHDGQNKFRPVGGFGCWFAEDAADHMIGLGLMRETILVAIDNTHQRLREYLAPTDAYQSNQGTADQYLAFVLNDVMPFVNANYRTLTGPENTGVLGSSFGGIASLYFGFATNVFGRIGPMSTSFWAIPNYLTQRIYGQDTSGLRIHTDFGSAESETNFQHMWAVGDKFLADGYVLNDTLHIEVGCGHTHQEWAWAERLPAVLAFLFNIRDESNVLMQREHPPRLVPATSGADSVFQFTGFKAWNYVLQRSPGLVPPQWQDAATSRMDHLMWTELEVSDPAPGGDRTFYRIESRAGP